MHHDRILSYRIAGSETIFAQRAKTSSSGNQTILTGYETDAGA